MLHLRMVAGRSRAIRMLLALAAISACLGAVAYAATRPGTGKPVSAADGRHGGKKAAGGKQRRTRPPSPRFIEVPAAPSLGPQAQFRFHLTPRMQQPSPGGTRDDVDAGPGGNPPPPRRFQCRLDGDNWEECNSPYRMDGLVPGEHRFAVRALSPAGRIGAAAHFAWDQLEPKPFSVEPRTSALEELYPGEPPQELPVLVTNPNPVPIVLTSLTVVVGTTPPGCPADSNFAPTPSSVSPAAPLTVPAEASLDLPSPAASAPGIALRDLPVDQNACQGVEVPLVFSGEAHG